MASTRDIGARIELLPMDAHYDDITVALYRRETPNGPAYQVHTYSTRIRASARTERIAETMQVLGGMELNAEGLLCFPCGHAHQLAVRRLFLDACKYDPHKDLEALPLRIFDKKAACDLVATSLGNGLYEISTDGGQGSERRVATVARGLIRLGEMREIADEPNQTAFSCGQAHDALIGLLLVRAPNVRSAMREAEEMANRGVLAAPSSQE
jgi:hypothetical protein